MSRRLEKQLNSFMYKGESVKIRFGTLILTCFCTLLLVIATFTQISLTHPCFSFGIFNDSEGSHLLKSYRYIPQIPVIFFIISLLGRRFGLLSICMYIIAGMFLPIFALGGGITYVLEYGFGYILAFIPAVFFSATLLKSGTDILRTCTIAAMGVGIIHVLGVLYMIFIATVKHAPVELISAWIVSQSGVQVLYDIFFSILAIYFGKLVKRVLWIIMC